MAIISDNLSHDSVAIYEYQKIILNYLEANFAIKKIFYFTDGASQHFKNKSNFANLLANEANFGIPAEWYFHPTVHGKAACDGIGENLERSVARHSLQCSDELSNRTTLCPILSPIRELRFLEWVRFKNNFPFISRLYFKPKFKSL